MDNSRKKILIIEDNDDDYYQAQRSLNESSKENDVFRCIDGEDALNFIKKSGTYEALSDNHPDIIVLDLNMPKVSGYEVLKELKKNDQYKNIPIVSLTLYKEGKDVDLSKELGADFCMTKPIDSDELLSLMKKLTNQKNRK